MGQVLRGSHGALRCSGGQYVSTRQSCKSLSLSASRTPTHPRKHQKRCNGDFSLKFHRMMSDDPANRAQMKAAPLDSPRTAAPIAAPLHKPPGILKKIDYPSCRQVIQKGLSELKWRLHFMRRAQIVP